MNKPKLFLAALGLACAAALLLAAGVIIFGLAGMERIGLGLVALGILSASAAASVHIVRGERQNQRVNAKNREYSAAIAEVTSRTRGVKSSLDKLSESQRFKDVVFNEYSREKSVAIPQPDSPSPKRSVSQRESEASTRSERGSNSIPPSSVQTGLVLNEVSKKEVERKFQVRLEKNRPPFEFVNLDSSPRQLDIDLGHAIRAEIGVKLASVKAMNESRMAVVSAQVFDAGGSEIRHDLLPSKNDRFGYFTYLASKGFTTGNEIHISLPSNARTLRLKFYRWFDDSKIANDINVKVLGDNPNWAKSRAPRDIKVASILDEFSYHSFKYECDLISLNPESWREQLDQFRPDLFLCESAWSGSDSEARPWMGRVYASSNFNGENRAALLSILEYCNDRGIPTVFWNKEDPSHYYDRKHDFVSTAVLFDHVFTTDLPSVNRYKTEHGHPSVHVLPFAVQPRLFNPLEQSERSTDVVFAGGWYSNHVRRSRTMERMFDSVEHSMHDLKVYDRFFGSTDSSHLFPERFRYALRGAVPSIEMPAVYKESVFGMTINTETESPTMFARRIFELMACNTYVISNSSSGVKSFFGDDVTYLDENPSALDSLTTKQVNEARARNLVKVLSNHTYGHRFRKILDVTGLAYSDNTQVTSLIVRASSIDECDNLWRKLRNLSPWIGPKVLLLDASISPLEFAAALTAWNRDGVRVVHEGLVSEGVSKLDQVFGDAEFGFVLSSTEFFSGNWSRSEVDKLRMHSQYTDVPIVSFSRLDPGGDVAPFGFSEITCDYPMLISRDRYLDVANARENNKFVTLYIV